MHAHILVDNKRIFIYRPANGWTNIALDSTEFSPKLTCDPVLAITTAWTELQKCRYVSQVTGRWDDGSTFTLDNIPTMVFDPLPEPTRAPDQPIEAPQTDAEAIETKVDQAIKAGEDVQAKLITHETKLDAFERVMTDRFNIMSTLIQTLVEKSSASTSSSVAGPSSAAKSAGEDDSKDAPSTPTTGKRQKAATKSDGKRRASPN